jgi:hypothetical protein
MNPTHCTIPSCFLGGLVDAFSNDSRISQEFTEHRLFDIIAISVCGVIAGAEGPSDIFDWAEVHQQKLITILKLEYGIPSRDTIRRVPPAQ